MGAMHALNHNMKNILAILEPSTLPIAIPEFPQILARIDTINSGILVPIATIVSPIIASEIQNFLAIDTAPSTSTFHPNVSKINPRIIDIIEIRMFIF